MALSLGYFVRQAQRFRCGPIRWIEQARAELRAPCIFIRQHDGDSQRSTSSAGTLVLALVIAHFGLFLAAWLLLRLVKSLRGTASIIYALAIATLATLVFGFAVLEPPLSANTGGAVGLVALTINLTVPVAVVLGNGRGGETQRSGRLSVPKHFLLA